jgi:hypothetical protein
MARQRALPTCCKEAPAAALMASSCACPGASVALTTSCSGTRLRHREAGPCQVYQQRRF